MRTFLTLVLGGLAVASTSAQCPGSGCMPGLTSAGVPAWRGEAGNEFSGWLYLCHGTAALRPDEPGSNSDDAILRQLDPNGIATATCNLYNFAATPSYEIVDDLSSDLRELVMQTRTLATPLDPLSFALEYHDEHQQLRSVPPSSVLPLPGFDELEIRWDLDSHSESIRRYRITFAALGPSNSLNNVWLDVRTVERALVADVETISRVQGGTQQLFLDAGPARAGELYLLLGSASGTSPGLNFGPGLELELAFDAYMLTSLRLAPNPYFPGQIGLLDTQGRARAALHLPSAIAFADLDLHHGFFVVDALSTVRFTSNVQVLKLRR